MAKLRFVLVGPRDALNLGAVARVVASTGVDEVLLVNPECDPNEARHTAVGAIAQLNAFRTAASLAEAIRGCALAVATESRRVPGRTALPPRAVGELARERSGTVAVVFGDETNGLSKEDLAACDAIARIPSDGTQPSYNLAQAALVFAYECMVARREKPAAMARPEADLAGVEAALGRLCEPDLARKLATTLRRARLTAREARLWEAVLRRGR